MISTWPSGRADVALCLAVIGAAATLADVASMQLCSLRPLAAKRSSTFAVERRTVQVQVRAIDRRGLTLTVSTEDDGLASVRHLLLLAVVCDGEVTGEAVAS